MVPQGMVEGAMTLTAERLRKLLSYNPATGKFIRLVRTSPRNKIGDEAGYIWPTGYRAIFVNNKLYLAHRLAWLHVHGRWPVEHIDHIDGNPSNNRIANLREASQSQNNANSKRQKNNKSGFKGVSWYKPTRKWVAYCTVNGRNKNLGYFDAADVAHAAYVDAAEKEFGEFAREE